MFSFFKRGDYFAGTFFVKKDGEFHLKPFLLKAKDEKEAREIVSKEDDFFCVCEISKKEA